MNTGALERSKDGFRLRVRLQPGASADRLEGLACDASGRHYLKARVRAVPEKGKANAALEKLLAKAIKLPRSAVTVIRGGTDRLKTLHIDRAGSATETALRALLEDSPS